MTRAGKMPHVPQIAVLEDADGPNGWGGRYSCTSGVLGFVMYDYGQPMAPVRDSDGSYGYLLVRPDDDFQIGTFVSASLARELAFGRVTGRGGTTITRWSRTVFDSTGHKLPVTTAPLPGWSKHATGPAVKVPNGRLTLIQELWDLA